jgi:hypothetical protein
MQVGAVVVGFDRHLNYYKIQYATLCITENPGCMFIATNLDARTHLTDAQEWAGNGSMVGAIKGGDSSFYVLPPLPFLFVPLSPSPTRTLTLPLFMLGATDTHARTCIMSVLHICVPAISLSGVCALLLCTVRQPTQDTDIVCHTGGFTTGNPGRK